MKISNTGLLLIKSFEGLRTKAYRDSVGVLTIGYGHTKGVTEGQTITEEQATEFLRQDVATAEKSVNKWVDHYNLNQNQFDALVSFTFNCGGGNLTKLVDKGNRTLDEIATKILAYNKAGGKELAGLTRRRKAEQKLFLGEIENNVSRETLDGKNSVSSYYNIPKDKSLTLIDALKEIGVDTSFKNRAKIARENGFTSYSGLRNQNLQMRSLLYEGKLKKAN